MTETISLRTPVVAVAAGVLGNLGVAVAGVRVTAALARVSTSFAVLAALLFVAAAAAVSSASVTATFHARGRPANLADALAGYGLGVVAASWLGLLVAADMLLHGWALALARTVLPCAAALVVFPAVGATVAARNGARLHY